MDSGDEFLTMTTKRKSVFGFLQPSLAMRPPKPGQAGTDPLTSCLACRNPHGTLASMATLDQQAVEVNSEALRI